LGCGFCGGGVVFFVERKKEKGKGWGGGGGGGGGAEFEVPPAVLMKTRVSLNFALRRMVQL